MIPPPRRKTTWPKYVTFETIPFSETFFPISKIVGVIRMLNFGPVLSDSPCIYHRIINNISLKETWTNSELRIKKKSSYFLKLLEWITLLKKIVPFQRMTQFSLFRVRFHSKEFREQEYIFIIYLSNLVLKQDYQCRFF